MGLLLAGMAVILGGGVLNLLNGGEPGGLGGEPDHLVPAGLEGPAALGVSAGVKGVDKTYQWGGAKVYHQRGHWPA